MSSISSSKTETVDGFKGGLGFIGSVIISESVDSISSDSEICDISIFGEGIAGIISYIGAFVWISTGGSIYNCGTTTTSLQHF